MVFFHKVIKNCNSRIRQDWLKFIHFKFMVAPAMFANGPLSPIDKVKEMIREIINNLIESYNMVKYGN